jgi:hypothetical protein
MSARAKVTEMLNECGAILKRAHKHQVWQLPNGKNFVRASTPSDRKGDLNNLSELKHQLEIVSPIRSSAPPKARMSKAKKPKGQSSTPRLKSNVASLSLAESLRMAGITDESLRDRVSGLENRMGRIEQRQTDIEVRQSRCWACRIQQWIETKWQKEN